MESAEPTGVEKLSKWKRNRLDIVNKFHSIRDDPNSRPYGFSHGYLILKTAWLSIVGNLLFYGLVISSLFVVLGLFIKPRHERHGQIITFLHFHISHFVVQWVLYFATVAAVDVASILFGLSYRKRTFWIGTLFLLVFIAPMFLFHWPFLGG